MPRLCFQSRVRHFLHEQPDSLNETYERILKGIHKTNRGHVQRFLQCLAVAIRPLLVDEGAATLTFDPDAIEGEFPMLDGDSRLEDREQELLSACPSLITIVDSRGSRVVQFLHTSVKEFSYIGSSFRIESKYLALSHSPRSRTHNPCSGIPRSATLFGRSHQQIECQAHSPG